ncbi:DUF6894 family protein [Sphingomonas colocasiae]|uniref:DUF6894 domain-containing protein n=1 Tax=Sphingomonas colocasiae TaxID=1848973 RepID=A0ABS7PZ20_9SPHN|nr:hypothetical protein [Sphingomonas colocasiae]MBY8823308.1 hypothetical protein [Sphingomonas colocasiae]MBY8826443.1 hypothetical protein [Sphingomonas colocasiae]
MAQYHFRTARDAGGPDGDPLEFENVGDARRKAVLFVSEMLRERPDMVWDDDVRLDVTTEDGLILFSIMVVGVQSPAVSMRAEPPLAS